MRVLFGGDSAGTGFGTVTREMGRAMLALGADVRFMSLNESPAGTELPEPFAGRTAWVGSPDGWLATGIDHDGAVDAVTAARTAYRLEGMTQGRLFPDGWAPDAVLMLGDMASLQHSPVPGFIPEGFPAVHYVPVEGVGLPPSWARFWSRLRPVAMTEFGADQIERLGLPRPPVVYHGVDTATFHPPTPARPYRIEAGGKRPTVLRSREDCKRFLGFAPGDVILFRADRNMPRKNYNAMIRAVAPVLDFNPHARLVWHCLTVDQGGDLEAEVSKYPERIARRMGTTGIHDNSGGAPVWFLPVLYAAADVYLSNCAEGFGLTIAESIACGTPAVGLDYSSVPEVIGKAGVLAPVAGLVDNPYNHFWAVPDQEAYTRIVMELVEQPGRRALLGAYGPYQVEKFKWTVAAEQMLGILSGMATEAVAA